MNKAAFKPLVVGAPRSGFALLCSVVQHFLPLTDRQVTKRQEVMRLLTLGVGEHISDTIVSKFEEEGVNSDLLYNPNFRYIAGGPKWIFSEDERYACFRKYIGVRGKGDFTLVTRHPREVLNLDQVVHSHVDPGLWLQHPGYSEYCKFASVRNPIDILNSSIFSLNALASEYIQKFVPASQDNDLIRQNLALYKFTDLDFFNGLVQFLVGYFNEFLPVASSYIIMKWEDLISQPEQTIIRLARESGNPISKDYAADIWQKLDHVNLTQNHKHNFREGHGVIDGWKNWITNDHLQLIKESGLESVMRKLGYGDVEFLNEGDYTPFQKRIQLLMSRNEVYREFEDEDLFTFAFNKSNLVSDKFPFKRFGWKNHTQIERSIFEDEVLQEQIWDCADTACGQVNAFIETCKEACDTVKDDDELKRVLSQKEAEYSNIFTDDRGRGDDYTNACLRVRELLEAGDPSVLIGGPPMLIGSEQSCNVVAYRGKYYALPHSLGALDLEHEQVDGLPGVFIAEDMESALAYAREL